jgi:hypothetical protein
MTKLEKTTMRLRTDFIKSRIIQLFLCYTYIKKKNATNLACFREKFVHISLCRLQRHLSSQKSMRTEQQQCEKTMEPQYIYDSMTNNHKTALQTMNLVHKNSSLVPFWISFGLHHFFLFFKSPGTQNTFKVSIFIKYENS